MRKVWKDLARAYILAYRDTPRQGVARAIGFHAQITLGLGYEVSPFEHRMIQVWKRWRYGPQN